MKRDSRWARQLVTIYRKGMDAHQAGVLREACPYHGTGDLQGQRRRYWLDGWANDAEIEAEVSKILEEAHESTTAIAKAERAGEHIDGDTMGFRMK